MNSTPEFYLVKVLERGNYPPHLANCAHAYIPSASVSSTPFRENLRPHEAFMTEHQVKTLIFRAIRSPACLAVDTPIGLAAKRASRRQHLSTGPESRGIFPALDRFDHLEPGREPSPNEPGANKP